MKTRKNEDLRVVYEAIFKKGEASHFSKMLERKKDQLPSDEREVLKEINWKGKRVLDFGCGTGLFAYEAAKRGAKVVAVDSSKKAIDLAKKTYKHPNLYFIEADTKGVQGSFDVIVSLGTLEHLDNPYEKLVFFKKHLKPKGSLILTCPNWSNPRGYMLMTLFWLLDAPITLADIHYFSPKDFEVWAKKMKMKIIWRTFDLSRATGSDLLKDFSRRLPNVFRDLGPQFSFVDENHIKNFMDWTEKSVLSFPEKGKHIGASALYHLSK